MRNRRNNHLARARYRVIDGKPSVELKLRNPRQLFDERDPAPFRERDLDDDAARYIVTSFRELKDQRSAKLSLYFESLGEFRDRPQEIEEAIHAFFQYEADMKRRELYDTFRTGTISLLIGLTFLVMLTSFALGIGHKPTDFAGTVVYEGLYILWLVAMWKPVSIFLYDWWPIAGTLSTYKKLGHLEVEIFTAEDAVAAKPQQGDVRTVASVRPIQQAFWKSPSTV